MSNAKIRTLSRSLPCDRLLADLGPQEVDLYREEKAEAGPESQRKRGFHPPFNGFCALDPLRGEDCCCASASTPGLLVIVDRSKAASICNPLSIAPSWPCQVWQDVLHRPVELECPFQARHDVNTIVSASGRRHFRPETPGRSPVTQRLQIHVHGLSPSRVCAARCPKTALWDILPVNSPPASTARKSRKPDDVTANCPDPELTQRPLPISAQRVNLV